jgi:hypothetical protein
MQHHPQSGKPPSHSATPELLQLLTSWLIWRVRLAAYAPASTCSMSRTILFVSLS